MSQYSHLWQSVCYLVSSNLYTSNLYISLPFALISKKGEICIAQQLFHKYPDISPFESLLWKNSLSNDSFKELFGNIVVTINNVFKEWWCVGWNDDCCYDSLRQNSFECIMIVCFQIKCQKTQVGAFPKGPDRSDVSYFYIRENGMCGSLSAHNNREDNCNHKFQSGL